MQNLLSIMFLTRVPTSVVTPPCINGLLWQVVRVKKIRLLVFICSLDPAAGNNICLITRRRDFLDSITVNYRE
jgi:hypothetical protein